MSGITEINHPTTQNDDTGKEGLILKLREASAGCKEVQKTIWHSKNSFFDKFFWAGFIKQLDKALNLMQSDLPEDKRESKAFLICFMVILYLLFDLLRKGRLLPFLFSFLRKGVKNNSKQSLIHKAPGSCWLSLATVLFSRTTVEETFKPMVGLWREDYYQALREGKKLQASIVSIRETYNFVMAMILRSPLGDLFGFLAKFVKYNL